MKKYVAALLISALVAMIFAPAAYADSGGSLAWSYRLRESGRWDENISRPIAVGGVMLIAVGDRLVMLDEQGSEKGSMSLDAPIDPGCTPALSDAGDALLIPLHGGGIEAVSVSTLKPIWSIPATDDTRQSLTPAVCAGGFVYYGSCAASTQGSSGGIYRCVDASSGEIVWEYSSPDAGFYHSGAAIAGDCVIFGDDAGVLTSIGASTGEVLDRLALGVPIRSGAVYSGGHIFVTSTGGRLHDIELMDGGRFGEAHSVRFAEYSTGTPAISQGYAYIGGRMGEDDSWRGVCCIVDTSDMAVVYTAYAPAEVKSDVLISDGCAYFTYNAPPGGLLCADISARGIGDATAFYSPDDSRADYCFSSPIMFGGNICYTNDSGYLLALSQPKSGGGTVWLVIRAAVVIIAGCAAVYIINRRRNSL